MAVSLRRLPAASSPQGFVCRTQVIEVHSTTAPEFIDITDEVVRAVAESCVGNGFAVVYSRHTTAAITINEREPLLLQDMADFLERIAPRDKAYRHNDFSVRTVNMTPDESPNGHAHCLQLLIGATQTIPVCDGELALGQWQRVFLVELDHARPREVLVQSMGTPRIEPVEPPVNLTRSLVARRGEGAVDAQPVLAKSRDVKPSR